MSGLHLQRGSSDWIGPLVFLAVIVFQAVKALGRGKVEPLPPPRPAPQPISRRPDPIPTAPRPAPAPAPAAPLPPKLRDLFDSLSLPSAGLPPGVPRPGSSPVPRYAPRPEPIPAPIPAAPPGPTGAELAEAARREALAEEFQQAALRPGRSAAERHGAVLDRLRLQTREDWKRAILLSEVLQPPLALR